MTERITMTNAISNLLLSLIICIITVTIFIRNTELLLVVFLTTLSIISTVIGIFYTLGWRIGRIEAVSLSILLASSVDYCMHMAEAFRMLEKSSHILIISSNDRKNLTKSAVYSISACLFSSAVSLNF